MAMKPILDETREFIDLWLEQSISDDKKNQIRMIVDGQDLILFFKYKGNIFGAYEPHRVVFASMKIPDKKEDKGWVKEASFMAFNLTASLAGSVQQCIFYYRNIDDIEVIDKEKAFDALVKKVEKMEPKEVKQAVQDMATALQSQNQEKEAE